MTIKKRLAVSNIIMIAIPVIITVIIGIISIGTVYFTLYHSNGFGFDDSENFYKISQSIAAAADEAIEGSDENALKRLEIISNTLNADNNSLIVLKDNAPFYSFGAEVKKDDNLLSAINMIDGDGFVSSKGRQVYCHTAGNNGAEFKIYLISNVANVNLDNIKMAVIICTVMIILGIIFSIIFTNKFLTGFIFKRIENPLDRLSLGVAEIGNGNLDYRIDYNKNDEFKPICDSFNDMAVRLKESVELTKRNDEIRKELLLNISHDLRSPLTSIQAYVEGLLDGVANDTAMKRKYLETIKRKTTDIDKMVSQLFEYSKLEIQIGKMKNEKINITDEINDIVNAVSEEYRAKGLNISVSGQSIYAFSNTDLLCRIVSNLLDNSLKYKSDKPAQMQITINNIDGNAVLCFADNGKGVKESEMSRIFDVFYRSDSARNNPGNGSGIGLAFVKSAVENMKGIVSAESNEYGGLTIKITLPAVNENE